jgi:anti-sigma B factor antagonist
LEGQPVPTQRSTRQCEPVPFACNSHRDGSAVTVSASGELDLGTAPALDAELRRAAPGSTDIVVDLRDLAFIDSAGVHVLLRWAGESARRGREFRVIPGSERVRLVFAMTGVLQTLGIEDRASLV